MCRRRTSMYMCRIPQREASSRIRRHRFSRDRFEVRNTSATSRDAGTFPLRGVLSSARILERERRSKREALSRRLWYGLRGRSLHDRKGVPDFRLKRSAQGLQTRRVLLVRLERHRSRRAVDNSAQPGLRARRRYVRTFSPIKSSDAWKRITPGALARPHYLLTGRFPHVGGAGSTLIRFTGFSFSIRKP